MGCLTDAPVPRLPASTLLLRFFPRHAVLTILFLCTAHGPAQHGLCPQHLLVARASNHSLRWPRSSTLLRAPVHHRLCFPYPHYCFSPLPPARSLVSFPFFPSPLVVYTVLRSAVIA